MTLPQKLSPTSGLRNPPSAKAPGDANYLTQLILPLPIGAICPVCLTGFKRMTGGRGRPLRFCSDTCRREEQRRQQRKWWRAQRQSQSTNLSSASEEFSK